MTQPLGRARSLALQLDAFELLGRTTVDEAEAIIADVIWSVGEDTSDDRICARARNYFKG